MKRVHITVFGCVQGVGFRPFVYRLANKWNLAGNIKNTNRGVEIDIQGDEKALKQFCKGLQTEKPERAFIGRIEQVDAPLHDATGFSIAPSQNQAEVALALLPDTGICKLCLQELYDHDNRRYLYPFLHCMTCGPRFSLFTAMPFDRSNTTMSDFTMCQECQKEYDDPENRRFYSQTNCCPTCGPKLELYDSDNTVIAEQNGAVTAAALALKEGKIVAVKNTGGYLLLVDATSEESVSRLRELKNRPNKPFALLLPDLKEIQDIAHLSPQAKEVLTHTATPIVLLQKRSAPHLAPSIARNSPYFGVMLPHNALQILLLARTDRPLVATSGNLSGHPLCINEQEAFSELAEVADLFLVHNRRINNRLDDSLVHIINETPVMLRRARGYIPSAFSIPKHLQSETGSMFAAGSHLKNTFALSTPSTIYLSQHFGDLNSASSCENYDNEVMKWQNLLSITPTDGIGDKHPDYYTSHYLEKRGFKALAVQHHEAHIWAGMLDCNLTPPFIAFAWDGTGYGDDHTIWGGETFYVTDEHIERIATLLQFPLPGGEHAAREPRRAALGLLHTLFEGEIPAYCDNWLDSAFNQEELSMLTTALSLGFNSPLCSSIGRLFDATSALIAERFFNRYEAEAPIALETLAMTAKGTIPQYQFSLLKHHDLTYLDWRPVAHELFEATKQGVTPNNLSAMFHHALTNSVVSLAKKTKLKNVLLTGGVFQNKVLTELAFSKLRTAGFTPHSHQHIPPNDGGVAVGQLVGTLFKTKRSGHVPCATR